MNEVIRMIPALRPEKNTDVVRYPTYWGRVKEQLTDGVKMGGGAVQLGVFGQRVETDFILQGGTVYYRATLTT